MGRNGYLFAGWRSLSFLLVLQGVTPKCDSACFVKTKPTAVSTPSQNGYLRVLSGAEGRFISPSEIIRLYILTLLCERQSWFATRATPGGCTDLKIQSN